MAADSLQLALAALEAQVVNANIASLPATEWSEVFRTSEGIYMLDVQVAYEYGTVQPTHPTDATATVRAVVILSKKKLDVIVADKPKQALAKLLGLIKAWVQLKVKDKTWDTAVPGLSVEVTEGPADYVEGQSLGFLGLTFILRGFDIEEV